MKFVFVKLLIVVSASSFGCSQDEASPPQDLVDVQASLQCHQCEGPVEGECGDGIIDAGDKFLKACISKDREKDKLCRVIHQEIRGEETVVRECGYELYKNQSESICYKTTNQEYHTLVCQCFEAGCNGVTGLQGSVMVLLVVIMCLVVQ